MLRKITSAILFLLAVIVVSGQAPDHYPPTVPEPVDITPFNLVLYILLPIALIVAFYMYQRSQKKKRRKEQNRESSGNDIRH